VVTITHDPEMPGLWPSPSKDLKLPHRSFFNYWFSLPQRKVAVISWSNALLSKGVRFAKYGIENSGLQSTRSSR